MSDVAVRIVVAVVLAGAALLVGALSRVRTKRRDAVVALDLSAIEGQMILFTASTCWRCDEVRRVLHDQDVEYVEVAYDRDPETFRAAGAEVVPLLVGRNESGAEVGRIVGRVSSRALGRLLARMR